MKKTILALLFAVSIANAAEVKVTGYGANYEAALENAKTEAIGQGSSTFIMSERNARNNTVNENIDEYTSGILKSFKVISFQPTMVGYEVTIIADVVPKKKHIKKSETSFDIDFKEHEQRNRIVRRLDDVSKAIYANIGKPSTRIGSYETTVSVDIELLWQQKWLSDMKQFTSTIDQSVPLNSNVREKVAGGLANALIVNGLPIAGAIAHEAIRPEPIKLQDNMMVCYGMYIKSSLDCFSLDVDMTMPRNPKLVMVGKVAGQEVVLHEHYIENSRLYKFVSAGDSRYNRFFPGYTSKFDRPALVIFENERERVPLKFAVSNDVIKQVESVQVYLR
jgi:hypothetical protein